MPRFDAAKFLQDTARDLKVACLKPSELIQELLSREEDFIVPAIHEAGHAIAVWSLGHTIKRINLLDSFNQESESLEKMTSYRLEASKPGMSKTKLHADRAIIALAGPLAERTLLPDHSEEFAWEGDLERITDAIEASNPGEHFDTDLLELAMEDAEIIIEDNLEKIMVLAMAAVRFGPVLEGADIEAILVGLDSEDWKDLIT